MKIHILTGDSLVQAFKQTGIEGDLIISRECLVAGDVSGNNLDELWQSRANYIQTTYNEPTENYYTYVAEEYEKLLHLPSSAEIYLWFEYDLFCQVNMWFCLWLTHAKAFKAIYRVAPVTRNTLNRWKGFGNMPADELLQCYNGSILFTGEDLSLGAKLWQAYQSRNLEQLQKLSESTSARFPYLSEVCTAHIERVLNHRPEKVLEEIIAKGVTDFAKVFNIFSSTEGVFGFGDMQVKEMYNTLS